MSSEELRMWRCSLGKGSSGDGGSRSARELSVSPQVGREERAGGQHHTWGIQHPHDMLQAEHSAGSDVCARVKKSSRDHNSRGQKTDEVHRL